MIQLYQVNTTSLYYVVAQGKNFPFLVVDFYMSGFNLTNYYTVGHYFNPKASKDTFISAFKCCSFDIKYNTQVPTNAQSFWIKILVKSRNNLIPSNVWIATSINLNGYIQSSRTLLR